ncbi:hypothetical protein [Natrinema ejinorense]|uniref:hypothetical protein n=1 Tax=Natrinema ejinorense TaxID=373386 RepID=UPI001FE2752B|nr:hypothetical protein [Natrinema ejinorense]
MANASVEIWGPTESAFDTTDAQELEREAQQLRTELADPLPENFDSDLEPTNYIENRDDNGAGGYVAVHQADDWNPIIYPSTTIRSPDSVGPPRLTTADDQQIILSAWDLDESRSNNQIDTSLPGATRTSEYELTVQSLSPTGEVTSETTRTAQPVATTTGGRVATLQGEREHYAVRTRLSPGVYRAYVGDSWESSESQSYYFTVGDPEDLAKAFERDLREQTGSLTERAQRIRDLVSQEGTIVRTTATTDANGEFTAEIDNSVVSASVTAYKAPDSQLSSIGTDPTNVSISDIRAMYELTDYNGSVVLSTTPTSATPPESNVTVETRRITAPSHTNQEVYQRLQDRLDELENETRVDEQAIIDETVTSIEEGRLQNMTDDLDGIIEGNDRLENRTDTLLDEFNTTRGNLSTLEKKALAQEQAIAELANNTDTLTSTVSGLEEGQTDTGAVDGLACDLGLESRCAEDDFTGLAEDRFETSDDWEISNVDAGPPETIHKQNDTDIQVRHEYTNIGENASNEDFEYALVKSEGRATIQEAFFAAPIDPNESQSLGVSLNTDANPINVDPGAYDFVILDADGDRIAGSTTQVEIVSETTGTEVELADDSPLGNAISGPDWDEEDLTVHVDYPGAGQNNSTVTQPLPDDEWEYDDGNVSVPSYDPQPFNLSIGGENVTVDPTNESELSFNIIGANGDEVIHEEVDVENPNFAGGPINIRSIRANTLRPGEDTVMGGEVRFSENAGYELTNITAYSPTGQTLSDARANVTGTNEFTVHPSESGTHLVELRFEDDEGNGHTESMRVHAGEDSYNLNPTLRGLPTDQTQPAALVGDGLEDGEITVEDQGSEVDVSVVVPADEHVPSEVHLRMREIVNTEDQDINIQLERETPTGTESLERRVGIVLHDTKLPSSAGLLSGGSTVYRSTGDTTEPIAAGLPGGEREDSNAGTRIRTFTGVDGSVTISQDSNAGRLERLDWWFDTNLGPSLSWVPTPFSAAGGIGGLAGLAGLVVGRRRGWFL